jgi:hypothetical protein
LGWRLDARDTDIGKLELDGRAHLRMKINDDHGLKRFEGNWIMHICLGLRSIEAILRSGIGSCKTEQITTCLLITASRVYALHFRFILLPLDLLEDARAFTSATVRGIVSGASTVADLSHVNQHGLARKLVTAHTNRLSRN